MKQIRQRNEFFQSYEHAEAIADGATGETIIIPGMPVGKNITVTIIAGANSGGYEYSTSLDSEVEDGTCIWIPGDMGTITGTESEVIVGSVSALRGVSVSGEIKIEIKI